MMLRFRSSSALLALRPLRTLPFLVLFCAAAVSLRAQAPPAVPKLAVEIRTAPGEEPSSVVVVQESGVDTDISTPRLLLLPGYESKDHSAAQSPVEPSNLDFRFRLHGEVMDIEATASFVPPGERSQLKERGKYPLVELGSFHGRLGDTISLDKMTELGFQPATIKIVSAERQSTGLPIVTHVPSITARVASQDAAGYKISLHNLSAQAVMAFTGRDALKGGNTEISESRGGFPMIAANGNLEIPLSCEDRRDMGRTDSNQEPVPCAFVIEAALFADGSYEGDVDSAAMLDMEMLAMQSQNLRIRQALQAILDDKSVPDSARVARMRAELSKLSYEPDPAIEEHLRLKYPGVSKSVLEQVDGYTHSVFHGRQTAMLLDLQGIEDLPDGFRYIPGVLASP